MEERKPIDEMNERELLAELLKQQTRSSRNSKILVAIMGVITAIAIIVVALLVPKAIHTLDEVNVMVGQGQTLLTQGQESLNEVDGMIGDMEHLVKNLDSLVEGNTDVIDDSIKKINQIDFDSLNRSIKNLADVLQPLANFFNILQ